ncbi:hypothetical protein PoB_002190300 [Plakobranchus ocellatus]|uniref:Uncharacterized protein n=1 Tax=Plakobranchus ocellatus TaxID=259542 RepID=A0AAV3ZLD1_9GAST|nr:hypothetical protein PoB_002190300 [Plakobranchus ocellatus]
MLYSLLNITKGFCTLSKRLTNPQANNRNSETICVTDNHGQSRKRRSRMLGPSSDQVIMAGLEPATVFLYESESTFHLAIRTINVAKWTRMRLGQKLGRQILKIDKSNSDSI